MKMWKKWLGLVVVSGASAWQTYNLYMSASPEDWSMAGFIFGPAMLLLCLGVWLGAVLFQQPVEYEQDDYDEPPAPQPRRDPNYQPSGRSLREPAYQPGVRPVRRSGSRIRQRPPAGARRF